MDRRELVRLLGSTAVAIGIAPADLMAVGRHTHRQLADTTSALGFFNHHQMHTVAAAGERIIPATDTPGAIAAQCHRFAERIVADHYDATRQRDYIDGLVNLDTRSAAAYQELFVDLSAAQQDEILGAVESDAYAADATGADSFWRDLKYLTLYGYYTSRIGIEEELRIDRFSGSFQGAARIADGS